MTNGDKMTTSRLIPHQCPCCESTLDAATSVNCNASPRPGDVTVCFYCAAPLEFTGDLGFEKIDIKTMEPEVQDLIVMLVAQISQQRTIH